MSADAVEASPPVCDRCEAHLPVGQPAGLCPRCRATAPATLAAIRAGEIPAGSVRADVVPGGEPCTRCKVPTRRLTPAHWNPAVRLCGRCCGIVAAVHDRGGAGWPAEAPAGPATPDHPSRAADGVLSDSTAPPISPASEGVAARGPSVVRAVNGHPKPAMKPDPHTPGGTR